jgi:hypothetical protein
MDDAVSQGGFIDIPDGKPPVDVHKLRQKRSVFPNDYLRQLFLNPSVAILAVTYKSGTRMCDHEVTALICQFNLKALRRRIKIAVSAVQVATVQ